MKRDILFLTLLAAATGLFLLGEAQASPGGGEGYGPGAVATDDSTAQAGGCEALAYGDDRREACELRTGEHSNDDGIFLRLRDQIRLSWDETEESDD